MTPSELVTRGATYYLLENRVKKMAKAHLSAEIAATRAAVLTVRRKRLGAVFNVSIVLAVCAIVAVTFVFLFDSANAANAQYTTKSFADRCGMALVIVCVLSCLAAGVLCGIRAIIAAIWANEDDVRLLSPLKGLYQCEDALRHFRGGGPLAAEWRDLALAERRQLHGFDVEMMAALHAAHNDDVEQATYQARRDAACKEVHGIGGSATNMPPAPVAG
jgi:hypothetical protein